MHKEEINMGKDERKTSVSFPKDFWTRERSHVTKKEKAEDMIPFKWSDDVLTGKRKAILYSAKNIVENSK